MNTRIPHPALVGMTVTAALMIATPAVAESAGAAAAPMAIDLTPLFQAVIAMLAALVTARVVPWIKQRTTTEQQAGLCALTRTLVYAAEQQFKNQAKSGNQKLNYVKTKLQERGFDIDVEAIEAAVMELNLSDRLTPSPQNGGDEASEPQTDGDEAAEPQTGEDEVSELAALRISNRAE